MRHPLIPSLLLALSLVSCNSDSEPERPEQQARTLEPYPVHTLPLGIRLDSLQTVLHGHSALFTPMVEGRLYRIIPLNAYENLGYGAVELHSDSTIRTYYWYTNIKALTDDQRRYYTQSDSNAAVKPVLDALTASLGPATRPKPYPNEEWHTWRTDSAVINLTIVKKELTLTKMDPMTAVPVDTSFVAPTPKAKPKAAVKKAVPKKKAVAKKRPARKAPAKRTTRRQ